MGSYFIAAGVMMILVGVAFDRGWFAIFAAKRAIRLDRAAKRWGRWALRLGGDAR